MNITEPDHLNWTRWAVTGTGKQCHRQDVTYAASRAAVHISTRTISAEDNDQSKHAAFGVESGFVLIGSGSF